MISNPKHSLKLKHKHQLNHNYKLNPNYRLNHNIVIIVAVVTGVVMAVVGVVVAMVIHISAILLSTLAVAADHTYGDELAMLLVDQLLVSHTHISISRHTQSILS